jgi:hypothetical protein
MRTDDEVFEQVMTAGKRRRVRVVLAAGALAVLVPAVGLTAIWADDGRSQLTADSPDRGTFDKDLVGRYWNVVELRVDDQLWQPPDLDHSGILRVDDDTLTAQLCTGVRAHVALTPTRIAVDQLVATGGYCWDDHANAGQQLIEVLLRRVATWSIDDHRLTLAGPGVRAKFEEGGVDSFPSTTLVPVPPGSVDSRALGVCESRHYEDHELVATQPHVVAAFDSTVDDVVAWYQATFDVPDEDGGYSAPGVSTPPSPADVRRQYADEPDRYAAVCWIQGFYYSSRLFGSDDEDQQLSVVMVRSDGREWALFGSSNAPERPSATPRVTTEG